MAQNYHNLEYSGLEVGSPPVDPQPPDSIVHAETPRSKGYDPTAQQQVWWTRTKLWVLAAICVVVVGALVGGVVGGLSASGKCCGGGGYGISPSGAEASERDC